jgi:hypothetical protein
MAIGRTYTVDSGLQTLASTSQTCLLVGTCASTNPVDIQAIRVAIHSGSGVSYPSNGSVQVLLARASGTIGGGTSTATVNPHNAGDIAANTTWKDNSTSISATIGTILWGQVLPFTAGANWAEWVTPGAEWRVAASASVGVYLTCSSAGTATKFQIELVTAE